jgi:hypothetical protein
MLGAVMLPFSIFRAAMFAEPTVTQIEEVVRLVHVLVGRTILSVSATNKLVGDNLSGGSNDRHSHQSVVTNVILV